MFKNVKLDFFPEGKMEGIKLKSVTSKEIKEKDFEKICKFIKQYKAPNMFKGYISNENLSNPRATIKRL